MTGNRLYVAKRQTPTTEIEGETVVLNRDDGGMYGLNPVAAQIWEWLQTPKSLEELVELLTGEFEVDAGTARADLERLLADLEAKGLV
jgi:hypothetical protein